MRTVISGGQALSGTSAERLELENSTNLHTGMTVIRQLTIMAHPDNVSRLALGGASVNDSSTPGTAEGIFLVPGASHSMVDVYIKDIYIQGDAADGVMWVGSQ